MTWSELLALSHAGAWGDTEKPQHDMPYLSIALGKTIKGEMAFGLATLWAHQHQVYLSSLDDVARTLTLLIDIGGNWVYAFMQHNKGVLHVPLSSKSHISAMINRTLSRSTCRCLCQLQAQKLLQCESHVVYLEGLNRGLEPVPISIPQLPMWIQIPLAGLSASRCCFRWTSHRQCQVTKCLSSQAPAKPQHYLPPCIQLQSVLPKWLTAPAWPPCFKSSYLKQCLTPPVQPQGGSSPRRPISVAQVAPSTIRAKDTLRPDRPILGMPKLEAASLQASPKAARPDEAVPISHLSTPTLASETPKVTSVPTVCNSGLILGWT